MTKTTKSFWTKLKCLLGFHVWCYSIEADSRACLCCPRQQTTKPRQKTFYLAVHYTISDYQEVCVKGIDFNDAVKNAERDFRELYPMRQLIAVETQ